MGGNAGQRYAWMAENMGNGLPGTAKTKIRLSDGWGGKTITTAAQFEYDHHGYKGYLGNVGIVVETPAERGKGVWGAVS